MTIDRLLLILRGLGAGLALGGLILGNGLTGAVGFILTLAAHGVICWRRPEPRPQLPPGGVKLSDIFDDEFFAKRGMPPGGSCKAYWHPVLFRDGVPVGYWCDRCNGFHDFR